MADNIGTKISLNADKAIKSLKELKKAISEIPPELEEIGKQAKEVGNQYTNSFQKAKGIQKDLEGLLKNSAIFGWVGGLKNALGTLTRLSSAQAEYIEDLNFLDEAYNNSSESGLRLLDTLEKTIGFDPAGLTRQLAMFRQIGNALDIDDKIASRLAENLIKLSVDVKSITGNSLDTVTGKFMSAMAGNTRAVRTYGIDITMAGLQQQALALGIDKSVDSMTRAEKSILTYITMARQMSTANGDMAKTVDKIAVKMRNHFYKKLVNVFKNGVKVITMLFKQEMAY